MILGIRNRLTLAFLLLSLMILFVISFILLNLLERYYLTHEEESLERSGFLAAEMMVTYLKENADPVTVSALAENFSRQLNARVLVLNNEGTVVGDSVRVGGLLGSLLDRPEVTLALSGDKGLNVQYSELSEQWVMQMAVPVKSNGEIRGAIFLSSSLRHVYNTLEAVKSFLFFSTLAVIVLVGATGVLLAERLARPIKVLIEAVHRMSEGDLEQQIKVSSKDEIGLLAEQFNLMASRLAEMHQRQRRFVSDVSHELRTPLTSLSLCVKTLKDYPMDPEEQREFLEDMDQEIKRLANLLEDLLALTKTEEKILRRKAVDLKPLLEEVMLRNMDRAQRQGIQLFKIIPDNLPQVLINAEEIKRVLYNLLDNAIKYTPEGGWIQVEAREEEKQIRVIVKDTGCGIPEEALPHVFERFYRVDKARSRELGGTGLGLAICREIIEKHGGMMEVSSTLGEGSAFSFTLPLAEGKGKAEEL
ncbi:MAG: cell wall metabolism sensor histidine kinase WalK [Firmicutes bacterium]|nr:cell wall metabolism sensor histidine kinase WalK [Bacillota bacterium]